MDLTSDKILNTRRPDGQLIRQIIDIESKESGYQLPQVVCQHLLNYPFETVRELVEKIVLYSSIPSDQLNSRFIDDLFDPKKTNVVLPKFMSRVSCSFTNTAEDYKEGYLSLNQKFIRNPSSTFPVQAEGDCMKEMIHEGDILIVDQSLKANHNDIVLAVIDGEFTMKRLIIENDQPILKPDNPLYHPIIITEGMNFEIRGVVTSIHRHLR